MKKWRKWRLGLAAAAAAAVLTGCGFKDALTSGGGVKEYGKAESMVIVTTEKLRYENLYSEKIWNTAVDNRGTTFESVLLVQIREFMKELKIISAVAEEQGISLSGKEKGLVKEAAGQYYEALGTEGAEALDISPGQVETLYTDYWTAEKLVEQLTGGMNLEVSDSEAKVIVVNQIQLEDRSAAEEVLSKVREEGADFNGIAKEYSTDEEIKKRIYRGSRGSDYEDAAYSLAVGQISEVIEDDGKYYILKCADDYDETATRARKAEMALQRKNAAFYSSYESYQEEVEIVQQPEVWEDMSISQSPLVAADFFQIFETVCKGAGE